MRTLVLLFSSLRVIYLAGMGLYFNVIMPLLTSHCGFSFVHHLLVGYNIFQLMFVQQLVSILVFSWVMCACSSTPPSFPHGSNSKESACNAGDPGLIPGLGRSSGEGNGYSLQYSFLENSMDRGAWRATVHGVAKNPTQLSH